MCGVLLTYGIAEEKLLNALNLMNHRGPYNQGLKYINGAGIGMVQLPMKSASLEPIPVHYDESIVSYNGEIYHDGAISLSVEIKRVLPVTVCINLRTLAAGIQ